MPIEIEGHVNLVHAISINERRVFVLITDTLIFIIVVDRHPDINDIIDHDD